MSFKLTETFSDFSRMMFWQIEMSTSTYLPSAGKYCSKKTLTARPRPIGR